jgi:hypothetical protein
MRVGIAQNVLWLNISMADSLSVDIGNRSQKLIRVHLHNKVWHHLFNLKVLLHYSVGSIRNIVHDNIKINLVLVLTIRVETLSHLDTVWMLQHFQDLKLSVLISFVLENFLDGDGLTSLGNGSLEDDSEGTISDNFLSVVSVGLLGLFFLLLFTLSLIFLFHFC